MNNGLTGTWSIPRRGNDNWRYDRGKEAVEKPCSTPGDYLANTLYRQRKTNTTGGWREARRRRATSWSLFRRTVATAIARSARGCYDLAIRAEVPSELEKSSLACHRGEGQVTV